MIQEEYMFMERIGYGVKAKSESVKKVLGFYHDGGGFHKTLKGAQKEWESIIESGQFSKRALPIFFEVVINEIIETHGAKDD